MCFTVNIKHNIPLLILKIIDTNYNKFGMINFFEYMHLFLISAQVMEMIEKEQRDFVYEIFLFKRNPPTWLESLWEVGNYVQSL